MADESRIDKSDYMTKMKRIEAELTELDRRKAELIKEAKAARTEFLAIMRPDCQCECDDNYCETRKDDVRVEERQRIEFCHDDQDFGYFRVKCLRGQIRVNAAANVKNCGFDDPEWVLGWKELGAGSEVESRIPEKSRSLDQTNTVAVEGLQDGSAFSLYFWSIDD